MNSDTGVNYRVQPPGAKKEEPKGAKVSHWVHWLGPGVTMTSMIWRDTHHFNENLSNKHGGIIWMYWDLGVSVSSINHLDTTEMVPRILGNFPNMAELFRYFR